MKILNKLEHLGDAVCKLTFSHTHDSTNKIHSEKPDQPIYLWHTEGNFSVKLLKIAASTAIVAGGYAVARAINKARAKRNG